MSLLIQSTLENIRNFLFRLQGTPVEEQIEANSAAMNQAKLPHTDSSKESGIAFISYILRYISSKIMLNLLNYLV